MPTNSLLPSVIGNVVAARQRLSAVRQRIGLEPQGTQMRELAPSPPTGPANRPGAAATAVRAPLAQAEPDLENFQFPPELEQAMLAKARSFIEQNGAQQQSLIDQERANAPRPTAPASQPGRQAVNDPNVTRALAPLAVFFKENGRLPTPAELQTMATSRVLEERLGRKPTAIEAELFAEKPPAGIVSRARPKG